MQRRASRARRIDLDGAPWRTTSRDVVAALGLAEGDAWSPKALAAGIDGAEPACARRRALAMLSRAERTAAGLVARLVADGFPESVARDAVSALAATGIVDDGRFASSRAASLAARGYGRMRVARALADAGVPDDLAEPLVSEAAGRDPERALVLARRLAPAARGSIERLAARLLRRGFTARDSFEAARTALNSDDAPDLPDLDA